MVNLSNVICIRAEEAKTAIVFSFMQGDRLADIIVDESYDKVKELIGMSKGGLYTKDHL